MSYSSQPIAGANFNRRTDVPEFKLGTVALGTDGTVYTYAVNTSGATIATGARTLSASTFALTSTAGNHTADTAFLNGEYGWVKRTTSPF
jgi:hypothetical protein